MQCPSLEGLLKYIKYELTNEYTRDGTNKLNDEYV